MINVSEEMRHLHALAKRDPGKRFNHLWENLINPVWLAAAWEQIRRNHGSQTAGVDDTTAVDVDMSLIHKLAEELKTWRYRPQPARRVHIPKANGKTRPLGIPTIKDRIVQQALRMLLEPIFEADFLDCSHGFRQGRSTLTALRDVVRHYPNISWIIEGDINGCFDNIHHGKLLEQVGKRVADEKILSLIRLFLKAGYLEDWRYHRTYSGTPQGGIISPLLANIFLHQLDEFVEDELEANRIQSKKQQNSRRNPEYQRIYRQIFGLRKKLRELKATKSAEGASDKESPRLICEELAEWERQLKHTPYFDKDKKHPCKVKYVRYADDFVVMVAGIKEETEAARRRIKDKLSSIGLSLSECKTQITHWSRPVRFLGYEIRGEMRNRGVGIRAVLGIPQEKVQKAREAIEKVCSYHNIPEADLIAQVSSMFRGWCNYYRYANSPQPVFGRLSKDAWWAFAHYLARKHRASIAATLRREKLAKRLVVVKHNGRRKQTFQTRVGDRTLTLNIIPPKTGSIQAIHNKQDWTVDLKPIKILNWQSGRSFTTRLAALDRANGVCERCKANPVKHVHHRVPVRSRTFLARVMSDQSQKETAIALCEECHLEVHGGSFGPEKQRLGRNAGCAERCLSGVGSAVEKPIAEM
jgi:retron-type reverse transcriptase